MHTHVFIHIYAYHVSYCLMFKSCQTSWVIGDPWICVTSSSDKSMYFYNVLHVLNLGHLPKNTTEVCPRMKAWRVVCSLIVV